MLRTPCIQLTTIFQKQFCLTITTFCASSCSAASYQS